MFEQQKKTDGQLGWTNRAGFASGDLSIVTLALGVFANFAWIALIFWAASYWIVWR